MADDVPALVQAARDFLKALKDVEIPKGYVRDTMPDADLKSVKGISAVLKSLGHFIEAKQELMSVDANKALIERLQGADGVNLADMLVNIATAPDDLSQRKEELRAALTIAGESLFDKLGLAVRNIARDKGMQLDRNDEELTGGPQPDDAERGGPADEKRDKGTWRESIQNPDAPKTPDADIRRAAQEEEKKSGVDDAAIRKSAQSGGQDFVPGKEHKTDYEKGEGAGDANYFREQAGEMSEIRAYAGMAAKLTGEFKRHLQVPVMGRQGVVPRPPGS